MREQQVLVTGASGFIGRHLLDYLQQREVRLTAMVRQPDALRVPLPDGVRLVQADLTRPESLDAAVAGQDAIVHLAGAADVSRPAINQAVNVDGTRHLLQACARQSVGPRILLFSSHCAERSMQDAYGKSKLACEGVVAESGMPHVIFRPTMIYGEGSKEFQTFVGTIRRLPVVPIIGNGRSLIRPVFLDDVLPAVARALHCPEALGQRLVICGPATISFDELVGAVSEAMLGKRRRVLHVPGRLALVGARLLGWLLAHPPITTDQVMGFLQDTVADPSAAIEALGFRPRPVAEGLAVLFARSPATMW